MSGMSGVSTAACVYPSRVVYRASVVTEGLYSGHCRLNDRPASGCSQRRLASGFLDASRWPSDRRTIVRLDGIGHAQFDLVLVPAALHDAKRHGPDFMRPRARDPQPP